MAGVRLVRLCGIVFVGRFIHQGGQRGNSIVSHVWRAIHALWCVKSQNDTTCCVVFPAQTFVSYVKYSPGYPQGVLPTLLLC